MLRRRICKARLQPISKSDIEIAGVKIELQRKRIKNINLRINLKSQKVTLSAPPRASLDEIKKFLNSKIDWIKEKLVEIAKIAEKRSAKPTLKFESGEVHQFLGKSYSLKLIAKSKLSEVKINDEFLEIYCAENSSLLQRRLLVEGFYRQKLKNLIPNFISRYEKIMNVKVAEFGVKKMKTRWGTCNFRKRRIWINLELASREISCLEFIIVHEMTHLLEVRHNKRFYHFMDLFFPDWKRWDKELKSLGIGYSPKDF
jgi:predicted metal-dependent hydrolase